MEKYTVDFTKVKYYLEAHDVIKESLDFPDYYGRNWGAFWDCITDMIGEEIHIEILGLDNVERLFDDFAQDLIDLLRLFKHHYNDKYAHLVKIEIVDGDKRIEIQ